MSCTRTEPHPLGECSNYQRREIDTSTPEGMALYRWMHPGKAAQVGDYVEIESRSKRGTEHAVVLITSIDEREDYRYVGWRNVQPGGGWDRRLGQLGVLPPVPCRARVRHEHPARGGGVMAGKGGRRWRTPEQVAQRELDYAKVMGPAEAERRVAFWQRLRPLVASTVASFTNLRELAEDRGERWSATYYLRRSERELAEIDATLEALGTWVAGEAADTYDAPEGAGESVEAYRG